MNTRVTILGNGLSRLLIPLEIIPQPIWGCNAIYRDYTPDCLFSIDRRMILEIANSKYKGKVVYRHWKNFRPPSNFENWYDGGCSGETAVRYAVKEGYKEIDLVGFDLQPGHVQNVYKGTANYGTKRDYQPTFPSFQNYLPTVQHAKIRRIYAKNYGKPIKGITNILVDEYLKELGWVI